MGRDGRTVLTVAGAALDLLGETMNLASRIAGSLGVVVRGEGGGMPRALSGTLAIEPLGIPAHPT